MSDVRVLTRNAEVDDLTPDDYREMFDKEKLDAVFVVTPDHARTLPAIRAVQAGYDVQEIRKGAEILFEPTTGEMLLTRKELMLVTTVVNSTAIVAGTYTVTPKHVRFNIRLVRTADREVIGMSTMTVPVDGEIAALLRTPGGPGGGTVFGTPIEPTVITLLP